MMIGTVQYIEFVSAINLSSKSMINLDDDNDNDEKICWFKIFFFHSFELILFEICQKKEKRKRENY